MQGADDVPQPTGRISDAASQIIASLLAGDSKTALRLTQQNIPKPSSRMVDNTAAGLAYMFSIAGASGFSEPMYLAKKGLGYFKRIESLRRDTGFAGLLARYVCGAIYTVLPDIFDTIETGIRLLTKVDESLASRKATVEGAPPWLENIIDREIVPAVEVRINRFLAEACMKLERNTDAREYLSRLIEVADADDEHAVWARLKKLEIASSGAL